MMRSDLSIECDDCPEMLPPRSSEAVAITLMAAAGWQTWQVKKFSGYANEHLCPGCSKRRKWP